MSEEFSLILRIASRLSSRYWSTVLCIDNLAENRGHEPGFDRDLHHLVNLSFKQVFKLELAVHRVFKGLLSFPERYEDVNIAVRPFLTPYE
jgi:hypothetical protein